MIAISTKSKELQMSYENCMPNCWYIALYENCRPNWEKGRSQARAMTKVQVRMSCTMCKSFCETGGKWGPKLCYYLFFNLSSVLNISEKQTQYYYSNNCHRRAKTVMIRNFSKFSSTVILQTLIIHL